MVSTYSQQAIYPVIPYKPNLLLAQLQAAQYKVYRDFSQYTRNIYLLLSVCVLPYFNSPLFFNLMLLPVCSPGVQLTPNQAWH